MESVKCKCWCSLLDVECVTAHSVGYRIISICVGMTLHSCNSVHITLSEL